MLEPLENKLFKNKERLYCLDDICIIPAASSEISHRKECNPYYVESENYITWQTLPIFAAPMSTVVSEQNYDTFLTNNITPILPRNISIEDRCLNLAQGRWVAVSLVEFRMIMASASYRRFEFDNKTQYKILIDIANGHMKELHKIIREAKATAKELNIKLWIMAGNVASPEAFTELCEAGADFVRCSVGSGSLCSTSVHTAIHYPLASLIDKCFKIKETYGYETKIIADGGINSYNRAITALALGADYVMIGTAFSKAIESAGVIEVHDSWLSRFFKKTLYPDNLRLRYDDKKLRKFIKKHKLKKTVFGMSTRNAQALIDPNAVKKTSEGVVRTVDVEYTLAQWTENFTDYLRSAMSYCNIKEIRDFVGGPEVGIMTPSAYLAYNK